MKSEKLYHYSNGKRETVTRNENGDHVTSSGKVVNGRVTSNPNAANQHYGKSQSYSDPNNPYNGMGQGEWDDYAHTSDDL